jgi:hypothetical protein
MRPVHPSGPMSSLARGMRRAAGRLFVAPEPRAGFVTSRQTFVRRCQCVWHGLKSSKAGAATGSALAGSAITRSSGDARSRLQLCMVQLSPTSHPNRGIDRVFEAVSVVGRGLVSIAEVHAIVARAHLAKSEPEMTSDRFGFSERHGFVKSSSGSTSKATGHSGGKSTPCRYPLLAEYAS